jgi:hypothetical protein
MTKVLRLREATTEELAARVKAYVWDSLHKTLAPGASRDNRTIALVAGAFPGAVERYTRAGILALTRRPERGVCPWCIAAVVAAGDQDPAPDPANEAHRALLGRPCRRCTVRFEAEAVAERERQRVDGLVAAGVPPAVAAGSRTPAEAHAKLARIRELERARPPRRLAATGVIWAGPQPAEVTAALQAAGYPTPARRRR